jgi:hypothetical protein
MNLTAIPVIVYSVAVTFSKKGRKSLGFIVTDVITGFGNATRSNFLAIIIAVVPRTSQLLVKKPCFILPKSLTPFDNWKHAFPVIATGPL